MQFGLYVHAGSDGACLVTGRSTAVTDSELTALLDKVHLSGAALPSTMLLSVASAGAHAIYHGSVRHTFLYL